MSVRPDKTKFSREQTMWLEDRLTTMMYRLMRQRYREGAGDDKCDKCITLVEEILEDVRGRYDHK